MRIYAETERLILREICPSDIDGMYDLDSDPDVHQYLGNKPVQDKSQVSDVIDYIRKQYVDNGIGRWAMIDKKTNAFLGWAGLKYITEETNGHHNFYDLGYRLIKRYWGNGFATEAAIASLNYGFNTLGIKEIFGMADVENKGSNRVLTKVGFTFIETFELDNMMLNWYKIDR
ncbi:GNAT family N-acetyltransferase [Parapedobacter sp. 10938]|uniref:GNAT family N-acetyltransferase n=1 Tax=Parapedobacter flavus TaxID=3110225 RepID=UPI002DBC1D13|nr:GNAT family N-acetyltransferase [Parapedobacter sp. 10938]MEC3880968.1 GNAT family N-acetyltransferase [Parapedobacter sp. 10938]